MKKNVIDSLIKEVRDNAKEIEELQQTIREMLCPEHKWVESDCNYLDDWLVKIQDMMYIECKNCGKKDYMTYEEWYRYELKEAKAKVESLKFYDEEVDEGEAQERG